MNIESEMKSHWYETKGPLSDGWYIWRYNEWDPYPEFLEINNGLILDKVPEDAYGIYWVDEPHFDYSGQWYGPVQIPE